MDITIRKPSLGVVAGTIVALLLFAGRFGLNVESHSSSFTLLGSVLYSFVFQIRSWLLIMLWLAIGIDYLKGTPGRTSQRVGNSSVLILFLLCFFLIGGAAFTDGSAETISKAFDVAVLACTVLAISVCQRRRAGRDDAMYDALLWACFLIGTAMSIFAILTADLTQRASVADGGPNTFVRIVGVAAIACIGLKRIPRMIAFGASAGYLTLIVLTQSRGGMLAFLFAVSLQFIWAFGLRSKVVFGAVGLASVAVVANFTKLGVRCVEIIQDRVFTQTFVQNYTAGRDEIYIDSWHIWQDSFLFGNGLNSWWDRLGTYPHNIFLELGCDNGLLGVVLFTLLVGIYFSNAWKCESIASKSIACITLFYFLATQFSGDIYDSRGLFYVGTMLSSASLLQEQKTPASTKKLAPSRAPRQNKRKRLVNKLPLKTVLPS